MLSHHASLNLERVGQFAVLHAEWLGQQGKALHLLVVGKLLLQGLNPKAMYKIEEINRMPGTNSDLLLNGLVVSGEYLMKVGLDALT